MNKPSVIVMCGQKGGTGKTTTGVSLACYAHGLGRSVLVVDTDPQASAQTWLGLGAREGRSTPTVVAMGTALNEPTQLPSLASDYDLVVLDCPSRIEDRSGALMRAALLYAGQRGGLALLPCGPAAMDVWALSDSIDAVTAAQSLCPDLAAAVVITRRSPSRTVLGAAARETLQATGLYVCRAELCYRIAYQEAPAAGVGVAEYAPTSQAAHELHELYRELYPQPNGKIEDKQ